MTELSKVIIHNFQSIHHLEFCPDNNITALVGETHSGKSAVIRAILWVIQNEFCDMSWDASECYVILHFADGNVIKRYKSSTLNAYYLNDVEYTAIGKNGVPDEIRRVINISDINIKNQEDPQYLVNCTNGERARIFNEIIHLEKIEKVTKNVNQRLRKCKADIEAHTIIIDDRTSKIAKFDDIVSVKSKIDSLDKFTHIESRLQSELSLLGDLKYAIGDITNRLKSLQDFGSIDSKNKQLKLLFQQETELLNTLSKIRSITENINNSEYLKNVSTMDITSLVNNLKLLYNKESSLKQQIQELKQLMSEYSKQQKIIDNLNMKLKQVMSEKDSYLEDNPVCPTCGKDW